MCVCVCVCTCLKSAVSYICCSFMLIVLSLSLLPDYVLVFRCAHSFITFLSLIVLVICDFVISKKQKLMLQITSFQLQTLCLEHLNIISISCS